MYYSIQIESGFAGNMNPTVTTFEAKFPILCFVPCSVYIGFINELNMYGSRCGIYGILMKFVRCSLVILGNNHELDVSQSFHLYFFHFLPLTNTGLSSAIKCYRCTVNPTEQTCRQFDEDNDRYIVDCPYSTMCLKKVYRLKLTDGTDSETVSRDCAKQKYTEEVIFRRLEEFSIL